MSGILFLAHRIPYPPDRGDKIRSFNIVKRLAELAPVHVAAFADDRADAAHEAGLRQALGSRLAGCRIVTRRRSKAESLLRSFACRHSASAAAFASGAMRAHVDDVIARANIRCIFAFSGQMGQYVSARTRKQRFVMDFVDVDSAKFSDYAEQAAQPLAWLYRREAARLGREERRTADRADISLFVTETEAALFKAGSDQSANDVRALGNGVALDFFDPHAGFAALPPRRGPLIVFTGQMDYAPNMQAVAEFARETLPLVRAVHEDATFAAVGRDPPPAVCALGRAPGVEIVGEVGDVRPWLAAADVVVAPLSIARGVQNKVLEAMAMARPVVASASAFAGIDALSGRDLLVADGPQDGAAAVLALLADPALAACVGAAARARMVECYGWDRRLAELPRIVFG